MARRRDIGPVEPRRPRTAVDMARDISILRRPLSDAPVLIADEQRIMAACEAALTTLQAAFWGAGKALQVIRDGRLYRATHATFEEYLGERWEMSRAQAYRLIEAWPLAEQIGLSPMGDIQLTERHVRALLPVAREHGLEAAAAVYRAVAETGERVTARRLSEVADALPADLSGDPAQTVRGVLDAGRDSEDDREPRNAVEELAAEVARIQAILQRIEQRGTVRRAEAEDADAVQRILAGLPLQPGPLALESSQGMPRT